MILNSSCGPKLPTIMKCPACWSPLVAVFGGPRIHVDPVTIGAVGLVDQCWPGGGDPPEPPAVSPEGTHPPGPPLGGTHPPGPRLRWRGGG